ncbi:MAG TPA: guanylate kinase [Dehalococcoidales bacterium]|nr:guanylate kinase [Dehalococcoidales bacterium]
MTNSSLTWDRMKTNPLVFVVSGPSGVGKDAILNRMKEMNSQLFFTTTITTRKKRSKEVEGKDYYFVSESEFKETMQSGGLLEWAKVYGNYYGVPRKHVKAALEQGRDVIIKVDIQGVKSIQEILPDAVFIMIMPPSAEELSNRLSSRATEAPADLALRLKTAEKELQQLIHFDYAVINHRNEIDSAVQDMMCIIRAEKCRVKDRHLVL